MQQHIDTYDFTGKKAIVRVDFNVPLDENFNITDDTRIRAAMPPLKKVLAGGGALILMSHLGRPKKVDPKFSLKHIVNHVSECLGVPVQFADDCFLRIFVSMRRKRASLGDLQTMLLTRRRRLPRRLSRKARKSS